MGIEIDAKSLLGTRSSQQDFYTFKNGEELALAVVCDGMGGLKGGTEASMKASILFKEDVKAALPIDDIFSFLEEEVHRLDEAVFSIRDQRGEWLGAGTTMVAVLIKKNELYFLTVGDSMLYACRGDDMIPLNREHNYKLRLDEMKKAGALSDDDYAREIGRGQSLISYIGMGNVAIYDLNRNPFILQDGDKLLLCTDGVTKILSDDEIKAILRDHDEPKGIVKDITKNIEGSKKKSRDNATYLAICYKEDEDEHTDV